MKRSASAQKRVHRLARGAVIRAVVVHEAPAVAEAERRERVVDVGGAVGRILGAGVLHRVVDALAGVFDVEHLVAEVAEAEQVHQRAPGDAAERVAGDDAGEQDLHASGPPTTTGSARPPTPARRASGRPRAARTCAGRARSTRSARRACPARRTWPSCRTRMRLASRMVERRCAMTSVVRPSRSRRSASKTISSEMRVERRRRLVEDQNRRVLQQRPGDAEPLALAARERGAGLGHERVVAVGQPLDERVHVRGAGRRFDVRRWLASSRP